MQRVLLGITYVHFPAEGDYLKLIATLENERTYFPKGLGAFSVNLTSYM